MTCTCSCHDTPGHRINRRATVAARLVEINSLIPVVEKDSKRTPPKNLREAWAKVEAAKEYLPRLLAARDEFEKELATLVAGERQRT